MGKLNFYLKGATLFESLIAMVVLVFCLGLSTKIYVNVLTSDNLMLKTKASFAVDSLQADLMENQILIDRIVELEEFNVSIEVKKYSNYNDVFLLGFIVNDLGGKRIYERNKVILNEKN